MNGVHDMGGMHGMGPIRHERNEPVFHEPWEGRVYAMTRVVRAGGGRQNLDNSRHLLELLPPADYLRAREPWTLDVALEIEVAGEVLSRPRSSWLYWTPAQMLAHMTVNGATLTAGDLFATGTVSGSEPGTEGSLGEIGRGERWLADGEEVVLRGRCGDVELGEVRGQVLTAAP